MAFERAFALGLAWRVVLLVGCALALAALLAAGGYRAPLLVAAVLLAAAGWSLWRYVNRTNLEVARFIEAIRFGDLSQGFSPRAGGGGFEALGAALDGGMRALRDARAALVEDSRYHAALVDSAPVALLTIDAEQRVSLANTAARRLLGRAEGVRADDFACYGADFAAALATARVGERRLTPLLIDDAPQRATLTVSRLQRLGAELKVVAVQPIQDQLNAVELAAQTDLVRVLTHEIMNSLTPVTSLARSAADLLARAPGDGLADARAAVETLAHRADGVMRFVETYRQISRAPPLRRRPFEVAPWAAELVRLLRADWPAERLALDTGFEPGLVLDADPDLMAQVVINLLRNAAEAAGDGGRVGFATARTESGRCRIEVDDDGPGIPEARRAEVFLPFFTTKPSGTGVGLSLARQVVLAHGGEIGAADGALGGARLAIVI